VNCWTSVRYRPREYWSRHTHFGRIVRRDATRLEPTDSAFVDPPTQVDQMKMNWGDKRPFAASELWSSVTPESLPPNNYRGVVTSREGIQANGTPRFAEPWPPASPPRSSPLRLSERAMDRATSQNRPYLPISYNRETHCAATGFESGSPGRRGLEPRTYGCKGCRGPFLL
jgi:hypothetical protein